MEKPQFALVTGGSRGIGAATASVLAAHGSRVAVTYHAGAPQFVRSELRLRVLGRRSR
jgi:3-oxoacyl-[acyl-carrier protein] reductase